MSFLRYFKTYEQLIDEDVMVLNKKRLKLLVEIDQVNEEILSKIQEKSKLKEARAKQKPSVFSKLLSLVFFMIQEIVFRGFKFNLKLIDMESLASIFNSDKAKLSSPKKAKSDHFLNTASSTPKLFGSPSLRSSRRKSLSPKPSPKILRDFNLDESFNKIKVFPDQDFLETMYEP